MTCLPSATTLGRDENFEFMRTRFEMLRATSLPSAIAIEQSASFKARVSLTPSPVIATTLPFCLSVFMIACFCSGETRPKTVNLSAISQTSSMLIFSSETYLSASSTPTFLAMLATVCGLSPEIILISTPLSLNHFIVSGASERMWSSITTSATGENSKFFSSVISALFFASTSTR